MRKCYQCFGLFALVFSILFAHQAQAHTFKSQPATLQADLNTAASNGEDDTILLDADTWKISVNGGQPFTYTPAATENFSLTITGSNTGKSILDGEGTGQVMNINTQALADDSNANIVVENITFQNGDDSGPGGGGLQILTKEGNMTVSNCKFLDNSTTDLGGGFRGTSIGSGNITLQNSVFINNSANDEGGGAEAESFSGVVTTINNIFGQNSAIANNASLNGDGGGIEVLTDLGVLNIVNNTFFQNKCTDSGGGLAVFLFQQASTANIFNNIVFDNTADFDNDAAGDGNDISVNDDEDNNLAGQKVILSNNDFANFFSVCDNTTNCVADIEQSNSINLDPLFADAANNNFHLKKGSPAIDTGNSNAPDLPATDFEGNRRDAKPDMGADEFVSGGCSLTQ